MDDDDDELAAERRKHIDLVYMGVVGMMVAVSWAYILQELADPANRCPARGCWALVVTLFVAALIGVFFLPWVSLRIVRTGLHRELSTPLVREGVQRLKGLATDATGVTWSVLASSFVTYLLDQLAFEATTGKQSDVQKIFVGFALYVGICVIVVATAFEVMIRSTRALATETVPYRVELWLMLSSQPYYPAAYALSSALSILFFAPLVLGFGSATAQLVLSIFRAVVFWFGGREISRRLPNVEDSRANATDSKACAALLASTGVGVLAAVGISDLVSTFFQDFLGLPVFAWILAILCGWAPLTLLVALLRTRNNKLNEKSNKPGVNNNNNNDDDNNNNNSWVVSWHPNDVAYVDVAERWVVAFAFWTPYKQLFIELWGLLGTHQNNSNAGILLATFIVRVVYMLAIASVLTLLFAFVTALFVLAADTSSSSRRRNRRRLEEEEEEGRAEPTGDDDATL